LQVEILVCRRDAGVADKHVLAFLKVVKSGVWLCYTYSRIWQR
jgi:hypothetical protein